MFLHFLEKTVTEEQIEEVALLSKILEVEEHYLSDTLQQQFHALVPHPEMTKPHDCAKTYSYIKGSLQNGHFS